MRKIQNVMTPWEFPEKPEKGSGTNLQDVDFQMKTLITNKHIYIFLLIIFYINVSQASEKHTGIHMNVLESQPIFSIRVNTFGIKYILNEATARIDLKLKV
jgi:hypothetical protein